jgi:hypothetical protein
MIEAVMGGFGLAVIVILLLAVIVRRVKAGLDRWAYNVMREPTRDHRDTELTLESIRRSQKHVEQEINTLKNALLDLRSGLSRQASSNRH